MSNQYQNALSILIHENKSRLQNTIDHYHRNLPPTYMETKSIVLDKKTLKDIREQEIKNTMFIDTTQVTIPISSNDGEVKEKQMYIVPDFLSVSHRKKMMKRVYEAYNKYVSMNKKNRDNHSVHVKALKIAIDEIHGYIKWVERNNDRLVKNYPDMFSYKDNQSVDIPVAEEIKESKGLITSIKKLFSGNKG